jgi:predicted small lipoprotein YifL
MFSRSIVAGVLVAVLLSLTLASCGRQRTAILNRK